jgi:hypothetical protein
VDNDQYVDTKTYGDRRINRKGRSHNDRKQQEEAK